MKRNKSEEQIIKLIEYDLEEAFAELYNLYSKLLLGVAYRYVADFDISQDILQEAMSKAFYKIGTYKHVRDGGLLAWLKTIVINESLNYLNSFNVRVMDRYEEDAQHLYLEEDSTEEVSIINQLSTDVLADLIAKMPEGYRIVLNMYAIEGYSHRDIALMLGIKEGSASSRYHRAKQELKKRIEKWIKDNE